MRFSLLLPPAKTFSQSHVHWSWQETTGVLHQASLPIGSEQFGTDYGVWLKEWRLLQRAVFVIDGHDHIIYVEYIADQLCEPDYTAAMQAVQQAVGGPGYRN